jgi:hypothetical protein
MGVVVSLSSSSPSRKPPSSRSSSHTHIPEIFRMRRMIKEKSQFPFIDKMVFMLQCPPAFPLDATAEYIRDRVKLPIFPVEEFENLTHEIASNDSYRNGFILKRFSAGFQAAGALKHHIEGLGMKMYILFFQMDGAVSHLQHFIIMASSHTVHIPPSLFVLSDPESCLKQVRSLGSSRQQSVLPSLFESTPQLCGGSESL